MGRVGLSGNRHQPTLNQTIRLFLGVALGGLTLLRVLIPKPRLVIPSDAWCRRGSDLDPAWPHRLGYFALQFNCQQAVDKVCSHHLHMVGQLEPALEGAASNTAVEQLAALFTTAIRLNVVSPTTGDDQHVLLRYHVEVVGL